MAGCLPASFYSVTYVAPAAAAAAAAATLSAVALSEAANKTAWWAFLSSRFISLFSFSISFLSAAALTAASEPRRLQNHKHEQ